MTLHDLEALDDLSELHGYSLEYLYSLREADVRDLAMTTAEIDPLDPPIVLDPSTVEDARDAIELMIDPDFSRHFTRRQLRELADRLTDHINGEVSR